MPARVPLRLIVLVALSVRSLGIETSLSKIDHLNSDTTDNQPAQAANLAGVCEEWLVRSKTEVQLERTLKEIEKTRVAELQIEIENLKLELQIERMASKSQPEYWPHVNVAQPSQHTLLETDAEYNRRTASVVEAKKRYEETLVKSVEAQQRAEEKEEWVVSCENNPYAMRLPGTCIVVRFVVGIWKSLRKAVHPKASKIPHNKSKSGPVFSWEPNMAVPNVEVPSGLERLKGDFEQLRVDLL
jgi:hypothetical protein